MTNFDPAQFRAALSAFVQNAGRAMTDAAESMNYWRKKQDAQVFFKDAYMGPRLFTDDYFSTEYIKRYLSKLPYAEREVQLQFDTLMAETKGSWSSNFKLANFEYKLEGRGDGK